MKLINKTEKYWDLTLRVFFLCSFVSPEYILRTGCFSWTLCINTFYFIIDLIQIVTSVILILFYRQARCFLAQNNLTSAKQAFRQTIQALDHSNLVEEKKLKWQRDVQIMLAMLDRNKELSNKGKIKTNQEIYFWVI